MVRVGNFIKSAVNKVGSVINRANPIIQKVASTIKGINDNVVQPISPFLAAIPGIGVPLSAGVSKIGNVISNVAGKAAKLSDEVASGYNKVGSTVNKVIDTGQDVTGGIREQIMNLKRPKTNGVSKNNVLAGG